MINTDLYATLITIIFIVESFWEFRLYAWLRGNQDLARDPQLKQRLASTMRVESKWNWGSWLLIILLLIAPDNWVLPLVCLLVLFETLVIKRMDNLKSSMQNQ